MRRSPAVIWFLCSICMAFAAEARQGDKEESMTLTVRRRVPSPRVEGALRVQYEEVSWRPEETAVIVCDMWNKHWCRGATQRVKEMAPRMNQFLSAARERGCLIIHAPSECMDAYENHPARRTALKARQADNLPEGIKNGCSWLNAEERADYPIDQSDGGCDCEVKCEQHQAWTAQTDLIEIHKKDAISDRGAEIWNLMEERDVKNVLLVGVHTNMCVLGRPFGLRNMARFGKNVVLVRDLTDTMYSHEMEPKVSHFTGTDLIVNHIERHVCPTTTSEHWTGGLPFRFKEDRRKTVYFLSAENEYEAAESLPAFARELELHHGLRCEVLQGSTEKKGMERHRIPRMDWIEEGDLLFLFVRRRALPREHMELLRSHLERGKPLMALRTTSHGFAPRGDTPPGSSSWPGFDREVLGCRYDGYPHGETRVEVAGPRDHPILKGIEGPYQVRETLYKHSPLAPGCQLLLRGVNVSGEGNDDRYLVEKGEQSIEEPVAWTHQYKGAKVFYCSLGSGRASFKEEWFRRMLSNAVLWCLE